MRGRTFKSMWIMLLGGLLAIYALMALFLFLFQSHLMYFPDREIITTPRQIGAKYEAITLHTEDGVDISAWYIPAGEAMGVVLFCHGNAGNISHRLPYVEIFSDLGLSTLIFDYRGFGTSEGSPSEKGTYRDVRAAWDYLTTRKGVPPGKIILFGESLGGSIAAWLAQELPPDLAPAGLILQSAFTSIPDMAARIYPFFPVKLLARYEYNTAAYLSRVTCPTLIVHSCEDELVPYAHGCKLYEMATCPKQFLDMKGDHNNGFMLNRSAYAEGIGQFAVKQLLK